ncbi:MAG: hypothetical protein PVI75_04405 [Gammaproteobacteria bacterium]|jgi:hypothetical protein
MKFNLTIYYITIPLLLGLAFTASATVPPNVNSFIDELNQKATIQQQENLEKLQEFKAIATTKTPQSTKILSALQKSDDTTNGKTINCDESNEYNYPSNFVYDKNHQKIYRLHPFAKCFVKQPTEQTPITLEQPKTDKAATQKSTEWNINY